MNPPRPRLPMTSISAPRASSTNVADGVAADQVEAQLDVGVLVVPAGEQLADHGGLLVGRRRPVALERGAGAEPARLLPPPQYTTVSPTSRDEAWA